MPNEESCQENQKISEENIVEKEQEPWIHAWIEYPAWLKNGIKSIDDLKQVIRNQIDVLTQVKDGIKRMEMDRVFGDVARFLDVVEREQRLWTTHPGQKKWNKTNSDFGKVLDSLAKDVRVILQRYGVHPTAKTGDVFDPDLHQVVEVVTNTGDENVIQEVRRQGYRFEGRVLRFAEVVITRKPQEKKTEAK